MNPYGQKLYPTPKVFMGDYLTAAHFTAHRAKTSLDKLHEGYIKQNERNSINAETQKKNMRLVGEHVMSAVKESTLALDNVMDIKTVDAVNIEEDIKLMKEAFENVNENVDMGKLVSAKLSAEDLAERWDIYFNSLPAKKGGKRTHRHRNRKHKRTHRKQKRTHRKRK